MEPECGRWTWDGKASGCYVWRQKSFRGFSGSWSQRPSNELPRTYPLMDHLSCLITFPLLLLSWTFFFPWESPLKILLYCMYYLFSKCILMVLVQFLVGCPKTYLMTKQQQQPGFVTWGNRWVVYGNEEVSRGEGSWEDNQFRGINRNISKLSWTQRHITNSPLENPLFRNFPGGSVVIPFQLNKLF